MLSLWQVEYNLQTTVSTIESNMTTGGLYETVAELPQATLIGQYNITVSLEGTEVGFKSITVIPGKLPNLSTGPRRLSDISRVLLGRLPSCRL